MTRNIPALKMIFWNGVDIGKDGTSLEFAKRINSMLEYTTKINCHKLFQHSISEQEPDLIVIGEVYPTTDQKNNVSFLEKLIRDLRIRSKYKLSLFSMNKENEHFLIAYQSKKLKIDAIPDPEFRGVVQLTIFMLDDHGQKFNRPYKILAVHLTNVNSDNRIFHRLGQRNHDFHVLVGDTNINVNEKDGKLASNFLDPTQHIELTQQPGKSKIWLAGQVGMPRKHLNSHLEKIQSKNFEKPHQDFIYLKPDVKELKFLNDKDIQTTSLKSNNSKIDRAWHSKSISVKGYYLDYGSPDKEYKFDKKTLEKLFTKEELKYLKSETTTSWRLSDHIALALRISF